MSQGTFPVRLGVGFIPREPPLAPAAVAGRGPAAVALARAWLRRYATDDRSGAAAAPAPAAPAAIDAPGPDATPPPAPPADPPRPAPPMLHGVAGPDLFVLVGPADALVWADGCEWLGRDPAAPGLYLPTTHRPDAPLALYARAALADVPAGAAPLAVLRDPPLRVPLGPARPVDRAYVEAWLARCAALAAG